MEIEKKDDFVYGQKTPMYFTPKDFEGIVWGSQEHPHHAIANHVNKKVHEMINKMTTAIQIKPTCETHVPILVGGSPEIGLWKCSDCETPLKQIFVEAKHGTC